MKHAVFLRGNIRTWNYCKKRNISFFNNYFSGPDWYVSLWDSKSTNIDQLKQDFVDSNAVFVNIEKNDTYNDCVQPISTLIGTRQFYNNVSPNYWRLSYLDFVLTKEKIKYELKNKFEYTSVTFIRPDLLYWDMPIIDKTKKFDPMTYNPDKTSLDIINKIGKMEVFATPCHGLVKGEEEVGYLDDFNFTAGSIASDIFGNRFIDTAFTDGKNSVISWDAHHLLGLFANKNNLNLNIKDYNMRGLIVRPNSLERNDLFDTDLENDPNFESWVEEFDNYFNSWSKLNKTEKEIFCNKFKIDLADY